MTQLETKLLKALEELLEVAESDSRDFLAHEFEPFRMDAVDRACGAIADAKGV